MFRKHKKLFTDPHVEYPLLTDSPKYLEKCKNIIKKTRLDHHVEPNLPFELKPATRSPKQGVLLLHGLLDSPFVMKDIGNYFQSQGMLVRALVLPGHGTVPGALLNVSYHDWLAAVE